MENQEPKRKRVKWTKEYFIRASEEINGKDSIDYSEVNFVTSTTKVTLICHSHAEPFRFYPKPIEHIGSKTKCPKCSKKAAGQKQSLTKGAGQEKFLSDAARIHGDRYDYSLSMYERSNLPIEVICRDHGLFSITQESHINQRSGCPKCAYAAKGLLRRKAPDVFIQEAVKVHPDLYSYPDPYRGSHDEIRILCGKHGEFLLKPYAHIQGQGCPMCGEEDGKNSYKLTLPRFIKLAGEVHPSKFTYQNVVMTSSSDMISITCPIHGDFTQRASQHLYGYGCRKCSRAISGPETEIGKRIQELGLEVVTSFRGQFGFEIDIYIPSLNIGIEYNGLIWHSERFKENAQIYHLNKTEVCAKVGVHLIHVFEDDWVDNQESCWRWLKSQLGFSGIKLNARDCQVSQVSWSDISQFMTENHIQKQASPGEYCYSLIHKELGLVAAMIFGSKNQKEEGTVLLERFCSIGSVRGGFSKMLKAFLKDHGSRFKRVASFSDRSWSKGGVYSSNGFTNVGTTLPRYFWTKDGKRYGRRGFQKKYLAEKLKTYDPALTEVENCHINGYARIWDCGLDKWELEIPK